MELDVLRTFNRASYHSIKSHLKLIEHKENKQKNQDILTQALLSILFIQSHVVCFIFEVLLTIISEVCICFLVISNLNFAYLTGFQAI